MQAVAFIGLKGNINDVRAALSRLTTEDFEGLKRSALTAAANKEMEVNTWRR